MRELRGGTYKPVDFVLSSNGQLCVLAAAARERLHLAPEQLEGVSWRQILGGRI